MAEDFREEGDGLGHVEREDGVQLGERPCERLGERAEVPAPAAERAQLFVGLSEGVAGSVDGHLLGGDGVAEARDAGREKGLLGFLVGAMTAPVFAIPVESLVGVDPELGVAEVGARFFDRGPDFCEIDEESGTERLDGVDGCDLGAVGHGQRWLR